MPEVRFKLMFTNKVRVEGIIVAFKPGTKSPTAMNGGIKAYGLLAKILEHKGLIYLIPPTQGIKIVKGDIIINDKPIVIDGQNYNRKYRVVGNPVIMDRFPYNQIKLTVELIEE